MPVARAALGARWKDPTPEPVKSSDNYNTQNDLERKINDVKQQLPEKERKKEDEEGEIKELLKKKTEKENMASLVG